MVQDYTDKPESLAFGKDATGLATERGSDGQGVRRESVRSSAG
jgi:hypothetical protein